MRDRIWSLNGNIQISSDHGFRIFYHGSQTDGKENNDMKIVIIDDDCLVSGALKAFWKLTRK